MFGTVDAWLTWVRTPALWYGIVYVCFFTFERLFLILQHVFCFLYCLFLIMSDSVAVLVIYLWCILHSFDVHLPNKSHLTYYICVCQYSFATLVLIVTCVVCQSKLLQIFIFSDVDAAFIIDCSCVLQLFFLLSYCMIFTISHSFRTRAENIFQWWI